MRSLGSVAMRDCKSFITKGKTSCFQFCYLVCRGLILRLYYTWRGRELVLLLAGGDKSTQTRDI